MERAYRIAYKTHPATNLVLSSTFSRQSRETFGVISKDCPHNKTCKSSLWNSPPLEVVEDKISRRASQLSPTPQILRSVKTFVLHHGRFCMLGYPSDPAGRSAYFLLKVQLPNGHRLPCSNSYSADRGQQPSFRFEVRTGGTCNVLVLLLLLFW